MTLPEAIVVSSALIVITAMCLTFVWLGK